MEINPDTNDVNVFRFCGEYFDTETGTVYLRVRYYQASIGRFISRDSFAGRRSDPLSLNLYTYCRNNPIIYIDPSGHSYATLPSGNRMTINSASDAKLLAERRKQFSESSSQIITTTAPKSEIAPITGGVVTQKTTTTYTTTKIEYESSQSKNTNLFSILNNGLSWIDNNVISPAADGISTFGKALCTSAKFEFGAGFGFGGEINFDKVSVSAMAVPFRDEHVLAYDPELNVTGNYSIGVTVFDSIGLSAEAKRTAPHNYADRNPYTAAGGKWENGITLISSYSSMPNENDFNIEIGGALYLLIGADFNFSFNLSNFARELGLI